MPNQRPRSNFDLICGMILGGLVVGVTLPATNKFLDERAAKDAKQLTSKKTAVAMRARALPVNPVSVAGSADATPARIADKIDEATAKVDKEKKVDVKVEAEAQKTEVAKTVTETPKKEKTKKEKNKEKVKEKKKEKTASTPSSSPAKSESLEEMESDTSTEKLSAKVDAKLMDSSEAPALASFTTYYNAQYSKDHLANCSKRCLIKSTDAKGNVIHAIINGAEFADVLADHQGTINITGVKRVVKNTEIFMVQSITFNVAGKDKEKGTSMSAKAMPPTQSQSQSQAQAPAAPKTKSNEPAWEDLSDDIKAR